MVAEVREETMSDVELQPQLEVAVSRRYDNSRLSSIIGGMTK